MVRGGVVSNPCICFYKAQLVFELQWQCVYLHLQSLVPIVRVVEIL